MKKIISILAALAVSAVSAFAFNVELDGSVFFRETSLKGKPEKHELKINGVTFSKNENDCSDLHIENVMNFGLQGSAVLYFVSPCTWLDLGLDLSAGFDFGFNNISAHTKGLDKDFSSNILLSYKVGPAAAFNLGQKNTFFVATSYGFEVLGGFVDGKDDSYLSYGGAVLVSEIDLGYRHYFISKGAYHLGFNAGLSLSTPITGFINTNGKVCEYNYLNRMNCTFKSADEFEVTAGNGVSFKFYTGLTMNLGRRRIDR